MGKSKLDEIFASDGFNLLDQPEIERKSNIESNIAARRFDEIVSFYEANDRVPSKDGGIIEKKLAFRLEAMRKDEALVQSLSEYDTYGILMGDEHSKVVPKSMDAVFNDDSFGLLQESDETKEIYELKHVKATERIDPDYVAQRSRCTEFDEKYRDAFEQVITDLNKRSRDLIEFRPEDLEVGRYYVLKGMILYLAEDTSKFKEYDFSTGNKTRRDGRTRCIFANGTESPLLYRSLVKALQKDGFTISDVRDKTISKDEITEDDRLNGYIYVLTSQSTKPEIKEMKNLYKIGFCSGDVHDRVKNAVNEPTYLMSGVNIVLTARCYNMNVRHLENSIHKFFGRSNANFTVVDRTGVSHHPREWFIAPLDVIERAILLIKQDKMDQYRYDPDLNAIVEIT